MFRRVLIANRGEIPIRIARAAAGVGIESVAVFAPVDALALHARSADTAREIGVVGIPLHVGHRLPTELELADAATEVGACRLDQILASEDERALLQECGIEFGERLVAERAQIEPGDGGAERLPVEGGTVMLSIGESCLTETDGSVLLVEISTPRALVSP